MRRSLELLIRTHGQPPPDRGCVASSGPLDWVTIRDDLDRHVRSLPAPPLVTRAAYENYRRRAVPVPGLDLMARYIVADWPGAPGHAWHQCFVDGVELDHPAPIDPGRPPDIEVQCHFADFVAFLLGSRPFEEMEREVRISHGGIGLMSVLFGVHFGEHTLRTQALSGEDRAFLIAASASARLIDAH